MNQKQRDYLIKEIEDNCNKQVKELQETKKNAPSLETYIVKGLLTGTLKIHDSERIKKYLINRAETMTADKSILDSGSRWGQSYSSEIKIPIRELVELPEEYLKLNQEWKEECFQIEEKIKTLRATTKGLVTRIQLASAKTLEIMINEVDDMGQISLMDLKIKEISSGLLGGKEKPKEIDNE